MKDHQPSRSVTRNEALLKAIESDLSYFHRQRMAQLQSEQMAALRTELANPSPDLTVIDQIHKTMVQTERDKADVSVTIREVVEPLRQEIAEEEASRKSASQNKPSSED